MFTLTAMIGATTMGVVGISQVAIASVGVVTACSYFNEASGSLSGSTASQWRYPVKVSSLSSFMDDDEDEPDI